MNARTTPFGTRLAADYDHHGIRLDLYGTLGELGYEVKHVCIPGTPIALTECVSPDALCEMGAKLDDTLPTSEELIKASRDEARAERVNHDLNMRLHGYSGMG